MAIPETPQMIPQSVPPLDDRGGDKTLPSLVKEVWWRFLNDLTNLAGAVRTEVLRLIGRKINTTAPLTGGGDLSADLTLGIVDFTGDSGSGGARGAVPAPASGSAAANKFLGAGGSFVVVPNVIGDSGSGGTAGLVPAPPAGSAAALKFLRADGTFAVVPNLGTGNVIGTAIFSATGGTISNTYYSGVISGVTRSSTGVFVVALSPNQINFTASMMASDDNAHAVMTYFGGTPNLNSSLANFTVVTFLQGFGFLDPGMICVTVSKL